MDNSWQNKCSSTWKSTVVSLAAASMSQGQPQQSRNHLEMNTGQYLHPHVEQESKSKAQERVREPTFLNTLNLGSYKSDTAELGNSFLAVLSGSSSLLQCDIQQLSNQNPFNSGKLPIISSCAVNSSARSGVPLTPTGPISDTLSKQNQRNGTVSGPVFSSSAMVSTNYSSTIGFPHGLPAASFNLQSSDMARAVLNHNVPGNGKVKGNSSLRKKWHSAANSANSAKLQHPNHEASQNMSSEQKSSLSNRSSNFLSGCPRVLCLSICGDLLLSNTGLLGVVCSCHCLHMSISKFCEHSGLYDVNPGDAVHMDDGETIAQWRKLYFQKFGIRVPDDQSGWDWPECFSATAGLVKSSLTMPSNPKNEDFHRLIGSPGASVRQARDTIPLSENSVTDQIHLNDILHNKQQRNGQDSCNVLFKGLTGASRSNFQAAADNQMSWRSTRSKFVDSKGDNGCQFYQKENGCQTTSACTDSISKSRNSFISQPTLQNLRFPGTDSNLKKACSLKDVVNLDQDVVSSNIELRLGQPYQQSWTSGNTLLSLVGPKPLDTLVDPPKSVSRDHLIHNKHNFGVAKKCSQYPQWVSSTSHFSSTREQNQSNFMNYTSGANNAVDTTLEQCKEDATKSSVISMLLSHINALSEENVHSRANHNIHNANEHSMHRTVQCESHIAKSFPVNFPWNSGDGLEKHINLKESGALSRHIDEGKGVRCVTDSSHFAVESVHGFEKQMENSSFLNRGVGGSSNPSITTVYDRNINPRHFSGMPLDASDGINFFNYSWKVPTSGSSGKFNNVFMKSSDLAIGAGTGVISPPQPASMCLSSATSTFIPNLTSALHNKEGIGISPYMGDENLRLLAARHMLELFKEGDPISPPGMKQHGRFGSSSHVNIPGADPLSAEQILRLNLTNKNNMSEVVPKPPQSSAFHRMGGDDDKLAPMAGLKNWCNLSTFMQGNPSCSKDVDMPCSSSHVPFSNKHHPPRLGRTESIISSNEDGNSCQKVPNTCFPGNCSCTFHAKCLGGDCNSKLETSSNAFKEQIGSVSHKDMLASNIDTVDKENNNSVEKSGNLKEHVPKKINFHSFQWKDVPNKVVRVRNTAHIDSPTNALDGSDCGDNQLEDAAEKYMKRTGQEVSTLKGREMSNISSGCSTPAVIQVSIDVTNTDSCTVDESIDRYVNDLVIDEGSANDKCGSSNDVLCSERSAEFLGSTCEPNLINERSSKAITNQSSCNLIDDLKFLDSLRWKKVPNQIQTAPTTYGKIKNNHLQNVEGGAKSWKTDRDIKRKVLDGSLPASGIFSVNKGSSKRNGGARGEGRSPVCNDEQMILSSDQGTSYSLDTASLGPNLNHKRTSFSSVKITSRKRDLHKVYNHDTEEGDVHETDHSDSLEVPHVSCVKRLRQDWPPDPKKNLWLQKPNCRDSEAAAKFKSVGSTKAVCSFVRTARPVVYGKFGIISTGKMAGDMSKPAKIVPLRKILKTARGTLSESCEVRSPSLRELKKKRSKVSFEVFDDISGLKEEDSENNKATVRNELDPDNSMEAEQIAGLNRDKERAHGLYRLKKERDAGSVKLRRISDSYCGTSSKPKTKEIRKRSLCELIVTGNKSKCGPEKKCRSFGRFSCSADNSNCHNGEECDSSAKKTITEHRCESFISDPGVFCCVCGSSNKDEINCLLECSRCLIRVHQACYGVAKVPKGSWYCRPCRTSSKDIACVLCGYGGGAMTRALRSHNIVKSLLKAWNIETDYITNSELYSYKPMNDELRILNSSKSEHEGGLFPVITPLNIEMPSGAVWKMNMQNQSEIVTNILGSSSKLKNSITVGVLDPTVKQWVHMVCGLWTPGTRCPNVDTMSAFDVSGASHPRASWVCSICNRSGGSSIQCRVVKCSVKFHPWCAHQKGLLQSEVEGVKNESVGFYGRCVLHATCPPTKCCSEPNSSKTGCPEGKELTCARTEGYKGRKRDGFRHNVYCQSNGNAGCLVPQEQLNAWLHINGQKSCTKGLLKQPVSDIEHDCRKEYTRYKHAKGWKHLVVYKSGIHALGLYTSQFIIRGAMVVEYVGEIVGLRVADKRECEYQSGRKLQYKSACYFFRIDKEHIIDATCKGGIARFVNHSCLPNCVAKVISVRNEKKVVFFAERDIYPGEEITYDYHFNHEDEGKKIPCYCNAKNCRLYMN